jgi:plasmid stabilization system protein ParE
MVYSLIWSPTARFDLRDVLSYIAEFDDQAASRFGQAVFDAIQRLADFPESGRIVPEFQDPSIREVMCKPCRIVYRLKHDEQFVEIARVWHAARGIPEM